MKFLKTTTLSGLFVLLPLMLLWIGLKRIGGLLAQMARPIADLLPAGTFDQLAAPGVVALILIAESSLLVGLAAKSSVLRRFGHTIESSLLNKGPMYRALKVMSSSLLDADSGNVRPALIAMPWMLGLALLADCLVYFHRGTGLLEL